MATGNRNFDTGAGNTTTLPGSFNPDIYNPSINTTDNRFAAGQGYAYDAAGNTTADAEGRTFVYDAENKQTSVSDSGGTVGQYLYDGDGRRVKKTASTSDDVIFVYDAAGKLIEERNASTGALQSSYVYAGSRLLSTETASGTSYLTSDHLGSPRINTDQSGTVTARHDYHPFGEEIPRTGYGSDTVRKQFTGYERDNESELDFAQARYYASKLGRFYSVDPENAGASADNPQTWSAYAYVGNNPLNITDPTGLSWYFNKELNEYRWYGDEENVADGFVSVVGNTGEAGSFSYEAEDGTFVTLDPYSNNYQTRIATKADAMKLADRLYQLDPAKRAFAAGFNRNYDTNMAIVTAIAVGDIAIIAGPVIGLSGAGTTTLGLTETATGVGTTMGTVAAANPDKTSQWIFGAFKSADKWANQLQNRGWTTNQITEAISRGRSFPAENLVNKANGATRFVHPTTGQSVVIDNVTKEILHVGGSGFKY